MKYKIFIELSLILILLSSIFFRGVVIDSYWYPMGLWIFAIFCLSLLGWERGYITGPRRCGLELYFLIWVWVVIFTTIFSPHQWITIFPLERLIIGLIFFYLLLWHFQDFSSQKFLLWSVFIFTCLISFIGIISCLSKTRLFFPFAENLYFVRGTLISPNNYAGLINLSLFLGFGLMMSIRQPKALPLTETISKKALAGIPVMIFLVALFLSLSRGGWVAFFLAGSGLLFWLGINARAKRLKSYLLISGAVFILGTILSISLYEKPIFDTARTFKGYLKEPEAITMDTRTLIWKSALKMAQDYPLTGIGLGAFRIAFPGYRYPGVNQGPHHSYNDLIELMSETGLISFFIFLLILGKGFLIFLKRYREEMDPAQKKLAIGVLFGILAFLIHDLIDFHFQIPGLVYFFLTLSAFLLKPRELAEPSPALKKPLLPVMAILGFIAVVVIFSIQWLSAYQFRAGAKLVAEKNWLPAVKAFQKSFRIIDLSPEPHRYLAKTYLYLSQDKNPELKIELLEKAEQEALRAIEIEPNYPYYWSLLGRISEHLELYGEAPLKSSFLGYQQAFIIDPNNPVFSGLFARASVKQANLELAKALIARVAKLHPNSIPSLVPIWLEKNYPLTELAELCSNNAQALALLAGSLKNQPQFQAQRFYFAQRAFELDPENSMVVESFLRLVLESRDCQKLERILSQTQFEEKARVIYADCLLQTKQIQASIEQYLLLIKNNPESGVYRFKLAQVFLKENDLSNAKDQLFWIERNPGKSPKHIQLQSLILLGNIFEKERDPKQALRYYQRYLEQKPDDQRILDKLKELKKATPSELIKSPWEIENFK